MADMIKVNSMFVTQKATVATGSRRRTRVGIAFPAGMRNQSRATDATIGMGVLQNCFHKPTEQLPVAASGGGNRTTMYEESESEVMLKNESTIYALQHCIGRKRFWRF